MNKHFRKVLSVLKTKTKALGFSRSELKSLAANIAENLDLKDDASDEDVDSAIEDAVDDAMPFLQVSQSAAQRAIAKYKAAHNPNPNDEPDEDDDDDPTDEPDNKGGKSSKGKQGKSKTTDTVDENSPLYKMFKQMSDKFDGLSSEISELKKGTVANKRKSQVQKLVKDTGAFGKRILREFDRMSFKDDDDFDEYLDGIKDDIDAENKERKEKGLEALGTPPAGGGNHTPKPKEKVYTDEEVKELAAG